MIDVIFSSIMEEKLNEIRQFGWRTRYGWIRSRLLTATSSSDLSLVRPAVPSVSVPPPPHSSSCPPPPPPPLLPLLIRWSVSHTLNELVRNSLNLNKVAPGTWNNGAVVGREEPIFRYFWPQNRFFHWNSLQIRPRPIQWSFGMVPKNGVNETMPLKWRFREKYAGWSLECIRCLNPVRLVIAVLHMRECHIYYEHATYGDQPCLYNRLPFLSK